MKNFEELFAELSAKVAQGAADPASTAGSATVEAVNKGVHFIGKKIIEEAGEVWIAAEYQSDEELAEEMSQLLYWTQVMMQARGLKLEDIYKHL